MLGIGPTQESAQKAHLEQGPKEVEYAQRGPSTSPEHQSNGAVRNKEYINILHQQIKLELTYDLYTRSQILENCDIYAINEESLNIWESISDTTLRGN